MLPEKMKEAGCECADRRCAHHVHAVSLTVGPALARRRDARERQVAHRLPVGGATADEPRLRHLPRLFARHVPTRLSQA